jgi:hypothetical protein
VDSAVAEWTYYVPDGDDEIDRQYANRKRLAERGPQKSRGNERTIGFPFTGVPEEPSTSYPHPGQVKESRGAEEGSLARAGRTRLHRSGRVVLLAVRSLGIGGAWLYLVPDPDARCWANPLRADAQESLTLFYHSREGRDR